MAALSDFNYMSDPFSDNDKHNNKSIMDIKGKLFTVLQIKHKWFRNRWVIVDPCFYETYDTIGSLALTAIQKNGEIVKDKMNKEELSYHMEFKNNQRLHIKLFPYDTDDEDDSNEENEEDWWL